MKPLFLTLAILTIFSTQFAYAQLEPRGEDKPEVQADGTLAADKGFIPCSGANCSACDFVVLGNTAIKWLITIAFIFFAVLAVRAGIKLVVSQGNPSALSDAKSSFTNAFIGLIIIFLAFLIVDTIMRQLVKGDGEIKGYGPWNEVVCSDQVDAKKAQEGYFAGDEIFTGRTTASGDNSRSFATVDVNARVSGIRATPEVTAMVNKALDEMGITDPYLRNVYRALISQESTNCKNKVGPDTGKGRGRAYGCSQFLVSTARDFDSRLDKRFVGKSDAEVAQILQNDNAYSIRLGALYFKDGLRVYGNNVDYTLASYNGGPGAVKPSKSCPGLMIYQCDTATDGYAETRNYVTNIKAVAGAI